MLHSIRKYLQRDPNLKNMIKNSGTMYVSGLISSFLIVIQQVTTAGQIGAADYGRFATIVGISAFLFLIVDVRTWELGSKLLAKPVIDRDVDEITRLTTWLWMIDWATGLISFLALFLLAPFVALFFLDASDLTWIVMVYAISLPFRMSANGITRTLIRMYDRYDWLSVKSIVYGLSRLIFISGAAFAGWGLPGVIVGAALSEIIGALILILMMLRLFQREMPGVKWFNRQKPRQYQQGIHMMRSLWLSATLWGLEVEMYVPILALMSTPAQVGIFRSALDIAETIEKLLVPFMLVLFPQIVKSYEQHTRAQFLRIIKQSAGLMGMLTIPFLLGIVILGPLLLPQLLNESYEGVAQVATYIALGFTVYGILMWTRPALVALNHVRVLNWIGISVISIAALLLFILTPTLGAIGAALVRGGAMVCQYILSMTIFVHIVRHEKLPQELLELNPQVASSSPPPSTERNASI